MANLGYRSKKTYAEKILVLLIESGVLYCLICVSRRLYREKSHIDNSIGDSHSIHFHQASYRSIYNPVDVANNDSHRCKLFLSWTLGTSPQ